MVRAAGLPLEGIAKTDVNPSSIDIHFIEELKNSYRPKSADLPITLTYISDNGNYADAARSEIQKRLLDIGAILSSKTGLKAPDIVYQDIPSQDWRAGAFDLAQSARDTVRGIGNILFVNCAPRLKQRGREKDNKGEGVYVGMLRNGTIVAAVSEDSFALFRDLVKAKDLEIYPVAVQTKGSQFRSRDFFTWFAQVLAFGMREHAQGWRENMSVLERRSLLSRFNYIKTQHPLSLEKIPALNDAPQVLRVDTHGNLKLSIRNDDIPKSFKDISLKFQLVSEQQSPITEEFSVKVGESMFDALTGEISAAPGSSGNWPDYKPSGSSFLELAMIGSSLRQAFNLTDQQLKEGVFVRIVNPESRASLQLNA